MSEITALEARKLAGVHDGIKALEKAFLSIRKAAKNQHTQTKFSHSAFLDFSLPCPAIMYVSKELGKRGFTVSVVSPSEGHNGSIDGYLIISWSEIEIKAA